MLILINLTQIWFWQSNVLSSFAWLWNEECIVLPCSHAYHVKIWNRKIKCSNDDLQFNESFFLLVQIKQNIKMSLFVDTEMDSLKTHYTYQSTHVLLITCYRPMLTLSDITSLKVICRLIYVYEYIFSRIVAVGLCFGERRAGVW